MALTELENENQRFVQGNPASAVTRGGPAAAAINGATIGGLIGAVALYFFFTWLGLEETILSLVGLIGGALAGSYLLMGVGSGIEGLRSRSAK